jgi:hypothetical protein
MKTENLILSMCCVLLIAGGCSGNSKTIPYMGFGNFNIITDFSREDIVVLDRVEGASTTDSILFGIIQVMDGKDLRLFWSADSAGQAYHNALLAAQEADTVFYKSMDYEFRGIPLIWWTETYTYKGKGVKLKADSERSISSAGSPAASGLQIIGYQVDTSKKDASGNFVRYPVYEDEQKK